jgi:hypothetical protein
MVPLELLSLEEDVGYDAEHNEGDDFLYDFQLHKRERSAVFDKANPVGRHLTAVFEESDCPREGNDAEEWPVRRDAGLVELQVSVPRKRHKDVATD